MTDIKLKRCPFCGGKAEIINESTRDESRYYVRCGAIGKCMVDVFTVEFETEEDAALAWNLRNNKANEEEIDF